ncbi:MAG: PKD domain-containing protein [Myxococcales bacterium]|nr:PKD domain-containing protein [Myxococcales bacterium]
MHSVHSARLPLATHRGYHTPVRSSRASLLPAFVLLAGSAGLAACGSGDAPPNEPPVAALTALPIAAGVGQAVEFDASASSDTDGFLVEYRFLFADGSPGIATASALPTHRFPRAGTYRVVVDVFDERGASARAETTVTISDEPPPPPPPRCTADPDCGPGERCEDGSCVVAPTCDERTPCPETLFCSNGICVCPESLALCGGLCIDLAFDPQNCGACGAVCANGASCTNGRCDDAPGCPPDAPLFCRDFGCIDPRFDPFNCGDCGVFCPTGICDGGACFRDPPGTVLGLLGRGPFSNIRGMTYIAGRFFLLTGRRFVEFDPFSGVEIGTWFIENESQRRAIGLAAIANASGEVDLLTGAYDRFGDPFTALDLERYDEYSGVNDLIPELGGAMATDGRTLWIYLNSRRELVELDAESLMPISRRTVEGATDDDWFTDLALDGYGGLWAVRPELFMGTFPARMVKLDLASASFVLEVAPPDPLGLGGVVLVDGQLYGAGEGGTYIIAP